MYKRLILLFLCFVVAFSHAQDKPGTSFAGPIKGDPAVCPQSSNYLTPVEVNNLVTQILDKYHIKNRYIIKACPQVDNCQAVLFRGKPYILYNPEFLSKVKKLNFTHASLPGIDDKDWETLTILAHELGHHINNHLLNPLPDAKQRDMELEADETAGFIIYLLGGTLYQAQVAYNDPSVSEEGDYEHPPRKQRLAAIAAGYDDAAKNYPRTVVVNPVSTPVVTPPDTTHVTNPVKITSPVKTLLIENANPVTDIDGNNYKTIKIDEQVWTAENLNTSRFRNGDIIPEVKTKEDWKKAGVEGKPAWCYYENNAANGKKYGRLYNWYAVNDARGLAPYGFHVPNDTEWEKMIGNLGGEEIAGAKMKNITGWDFKGGVPGSGNGTNTSGFAGLPGGYRYGDYGSFHVIDNEGYWWSSTESNTNPPRAWSQILAKKIGAIYRLGYNEFNGFSVRCIRD